MTDQPTLSLVMIVRDEETMLPGLLESAGDLFDEMVIVDTGSEDKTIELAEQAGAKVIQTTWADDFAAARNLSLSHATGTWVAFFDADERLTADLVVQLRALVDSNNRRIGAATITMRNKLPSGSVHDASLLRVFRRDDSIRFKHRIHEDVSESLTAYLDRHQMTTVNLSGVVEHLGYVREVAASRDKFNRDRRLLESCITDDPTDLYSHFKLMELARYWQDHTLWKDVAKATASILKGASAAEVTSHHFAAELLCLTVRGLFDTDFEAAHGWLSPWLSHLRSSSVLTYWLGSFAEQTQRFDEAYRHYEHCLTLPPVRDRQMNEVRPLMGLCRLSLMKGDLDGATDYTARALRLNNLDDEVVMAARALADTFIVDGRGGQAATLMALLAGTPPEGPDGITLGRSLLLAGKVEEAKQVALGLLDELAEAGIGVLVCNLCLGEHTELELNISQEDADMALKAWVDVALRSEQREVATMFCDHAGLITGIFPWLERYVLDMLGIEPDA